MLATLPVLAGTLRVRGGADHVVLAGRADELRAGGGNDPYEMGGVCEEYGAEFGEGQFPVEDDETLAGLRAELEEVERELEDAQDARAVAEQVMETTYICIYIHFSIDLYMYVNTQTHTHTRIHVLYCRSTCGSKEQWRSNTHTHKSVVFFKRYFCKRYFCTKKKTTDSINHIKRYFCKQYLRIYIYVVTWYVIYRCKIA